jgi:hypothetical protein
MFDSLDEQIKADAHAASSTKERVFMWLAIAIVSVAVFGGLYIGVRMLD